MSNTPRTDARLMVVTDNDTCKIKVLETVHASFVRILEREVNALTSERDQLRAELDAAKEQLRTEAVDDYSAIKELQRELRTERARLDWVFRNCKVTAEDYTTGNRDVYAIHDREGLDAAMKEDAK